VKRAYATFKKMWDEGLIYRGERLVNYCTFHRTGFADIEVVYKEAKTPLYYMKYGPFTLATTRPETKFGDTAVAVHPDDKRYQKYIGTVIEVEGVNGPFNVQVIADEMVDPEFGTGVVKITPAHSFDDWEAGKRHNLPVKRVINHDGTMNHEAGRFEGLTIMEARKAVVEALEEKGLLVEVDTDYANRVGHCYKCDTVIEPMLMEQWFIEMETLAKPAIESLKSNEIDFYPDTKKDQLIGYLEGLRDWNISRQIAWGIPIPAFQNVDDSDDWIYDERVDQEIITVDGKTYHRDPDVFDTWFSSSSWPYATLNYGDEDSTDFEKYYPLSLMETGGEILYPWVSRMLMLGLYNTGSIPFKAVYIHGYVMAEDGAKMSKSLGNVINPLQEIDKYGSDALRMGIIAGRTPAVNRGYDHRKVEDARNFCNKLWNISRYIEDRLGDAPIISLQPEPKSSADYWIMGRLHNAIKVVSGNLDDYRFSEAYDNLYHFIWDDFADWYLEASKVSTNPSILAFCLDSILRLAHPFAPFVTEAIWQSINWHPGVLLATNNWPNFEWTSSKKEQDFDLIKELAVEVRSIKSSLSITDKLSLFYEGKINPADQDLIRRLGGLLEVTRGSKGLQLLTGSKHLAFKLNVDAESIKQYVTKLNDQEKLEAQNISRLKERLANKQYISKAPESLVNETKKQLADAQERLNLIKQDYSRFSGKVNLK
jgi:valyl-tRNA synthetase